MSADLISVTEARQLIAENTAPFAAVRKPLRDSAGLVLAEPVYSTIDIPAFHQSSMDGYAFNFDGWQKHKRLKIAGIVAAGLVDKEILLPQNATRIFTGAVVPEGADTVVMQEKIKVENGDLIIEDSALLQGVNTRPPGSEIRAGELALPENTILSPAAIGFLTGIGVTEVVVYPRPLISIILTGNELQEPGLPLSLGQVYESNSYSLKAALKQIQIDEVLVFHAEDSLEILSNTLRKALEQSDVVFLTGGVSVGDYDFVVQAAAQNGVRKIFHKIKQKPGKPLFFGKKEDKYIFGLPGNPSSVLTCFYEYVLPCLGTMSKRNLALQKIMAPLAKSYKKAAGLTHFLKARYNDHAALLLDAQESFRLSSFAKANCLVQVDEDKTECQEGEMVEVHLLPV